MTNLTEQWKKGKIKKAKYWVKYRNGNINIWELSEGITIESKPEIIEVLAPVPSYEEWEAMLESNDSLVQTINALKNRLVDVGEENKQLKKLCKMLIITPNKCDKELLKLLDKF